MRQKGFTLLEVLIAMLVLAIGLLGLAGLMASSLRNNHSAYYRTQATWLAYDVIDRMRANRNNAADYMVAFEDAGPGAGIAGEDITNWKAMIGATLPGGSGSISMVAVGAVQDVTVVIQWDDSRGTGGDAAQQFQVMSRL